MKKSNTKTAGIIIIGNEILNGRTQDTNTNTIAKRLGEIGVQVSEVRIIPDITEIIGTTVLHFSSCFDYVFTCGGIGPTHDDKTASAIASAFKVSLLRSEDAYDRLVKHYGDESYMNDGRIKMALIPDGAKLIDNPVSAAPGFKIGNVHVMAGVPKIMEGMLENIIPTLEGGDVIKAKQVVVYKPESEMATILEKLETDYKNIDVGSYPRFKDGKPEVTVIIRGTEDDSVIKAYEDLKSLVL